ncbi:hypothetical protein PRIPAC_81796 [Pristionchus pacificus]|uniref:Uncharacterized protein n=1 Tax=Pristionchus pacificus TaxID=54126 RepID=A0A2A6CJV3_PRIPA|nr:hypothetical protein PRIPAC_81796 [Pristionchus pacificus]|eukprot:PDM78505.1 hypothetical protein PRIPAC_31084 [Pristionchus pacificus]
MYSTTAVRLFDPHDPRYYQCCCAARIHVASMAKAIAGICIFSNVVSIWPAIINGTTVTSIVATVFSSGVMAVAAFQEHRPTLILLLVLQGLGLSCIALVVFLFIVALIVGVDTSPVFRQYGPLLLCVAVFQILLGLWSFTVNLHFYAFLTDRERAGQMVYQYRAAEQQQQPSSSRGGPPRGYREQPQKPNRPVNEDHISYPIYPVKRTPSMTPSSPSIVPSAPAVVPDNQPPPPYESLEEQQNCENEEKE